MFAEGISICMAYMLLFISITNEEAFIAKSINLSNFMAKSIQYCHMIDLAMRNSTLFNILSGIRIVMTKMLLCQIN